MFTKRVGRAAAWVMVDRWGQRVIGLVVLAVLARLLEKSDFGLVSMAAVLIAISERFVGLGVGAALVQKADIEESDYDTGFWISVGLALVVCVAVFVLAPVAGAYFEDGRVVSVTRVLSLALLAGGASSVHLAILEKQLDFRSLAIRKLTGVLVGGMIGVAIALRGGGVWALVGEWLAASTIGLLLLWRVVDWRPSWRFRRQSATKLLSFGAYVSFASFLVSVRRQIDSVLLGRLLGATSLGVFVIGSRVPDLVQQTIGGPVTRVAFPALANVNAGPIKENVLKGTSMYTYLAFPSMAGVAILAEDIVAVVLGREWMDAVPVVRFIAVGLLVGSSTYLTVPALKAAGLAKLTLWQSVGVTLARIAVIVALANRGLDIIVMGLAATSAVLVPIQLVLLRYGIGISPPDMVRSVRTSLGITGIMAMSVLVLHQAMDGGPTVVSAIVSVVVGIAMYLGVHAVFRTRVQKQAWKLLRLVLARD